MSLNLITHGNVSFFFGDLTPAHLELSPIWCDFFDYFEREEDFPEISTEWLEENIFQVEKERNGEHPTYYIKNKNIDYFRRQFSYASADFFLKNSKLSGYLTIVCDDPNDPNDPEITSANILINNEIFTLFSHASEENIEPLEYLSAHFNDDFMSETTISYTMSEKIKGINMFGIKEKGVFHFSITDDD